MLVADKIYIAKGEHRVDRGILKALTYDNPDYHQKMNLGLSVHGVPKTIATYSFSADGQQLIVMRGEALKVKRYVDPPAFSLHHPDHPVKLQYVNADFELDEHQQAAVEAIKRKKQGIIHAVTSAGKSLIILKAIVELGQKACIIVHRKVLMKQFLDDIHKYIRDEHGNRITPGIIGDGQATEGPITIAIDKTLGRDLEKHRESFGTVILDECHLAPAATLFGILNGINSRHRYGLTGTLRRKDEKQFLIYATFGEVIASITKDELLEKGRVVPVKVEILRSDVRFDWDSAVEALGSTTKARALQEEVIANAPERNDQIIRHLSTLTGKVIVLSRYVQPCLDLAYLYEQRYGKKAGVITGRNAKAALAAYDEMKNGDLQVIFATIGCVSTGVSISDLDHIVLISPVYTNELLLHQIRGRLMRTSEGKEFGTLWYVYDENIFPQWKLAKFMRIMRS